MLVERKFLFDGVVKDYAEARPGYPVELLNDLIELAGLDIDSKILEIGCGTGQATQLFVEHGLDIIAIELGKNMAECAKERFNGYDRIKIINQPFEEYRTDDRYKLIFAASAFHWIDPKAGMPLIHSLLEDGGWLALFWNSKSERDVDSELYHEINAIYDKYYKEPNERIKLSHFERAKLIEDSGLFCNLITKEYPYSLTYSSEKYVQLLGTYSDHIAQTEENKHNLFEKIKETIDKHGGVISIPYEVKAYFARKI